MTAEALATPPPTDVMPPEAQSAAVIGRVWQLLAFTLGGVCAAYAASAMFLIATWDGVRVRNELTLELRERCERSLTMEVLPRLSFKPWPALIIEGVTLSEPAGAGVAARIGRIEAGLALGPLIAGRLAVTRLALIDPEIRLSRRPDGALSFFDLGRSSEGRSWPASFDLATLLVERGKVDMIDAHGETWLRLERLSFTTGPLASGVRGSLSGEASLIHGPGEASGGIEFDVGYVPGQIGYDLQSTRLRFRGDAWGATALDTEVSIGEGRGDLGEALDLVDVSLRGHGRFGMDTLSVKANADNVTGRHGTFSIADFKANFLAANADDRFEAQLLSPAIAPIGADAKGAPLQVVFAHRSSSRSNEGQLSARIGYLAQAGRIVLDDLALEWMSARARGKTGAMGSAKGRADFSPTGQAASLSVRASMNGLHGKLALDYDATRPVPMQLELDADSLDPARFVVVTPFGSLSRLSSVLAAHPLQGRLRTANLSLGGLRASHVSSAFETGGGALRFVGLDLEAYGGSMSGNVEYQPVSRRLLLDQQLKGVSLGPLLGGIAMDMPLRGEASGAWKLTGFGTEDAFAQGLAGNLQLTVRNAQWQGMDITEFLRAVRPAVKDRRAITRTGAARERQAFDSMSIECDLAAKGADCSGLSARNEWLSLSGTGSVSQNGRLDWRARISLDGRAIPRDLGGLRGKTIAARVVGPLRRQIWKLDWSSKDRESGASIVARPYVSRPKPAVAPASQPSASG